MAFKAEKLQGLIHKSKTDEYENGKAFVIVQLLKDKYAPVDRYSRHEETKELAAVRMGKREDPGEPKDCIPLQTSIKPTNTAWV